MNLKNTSMILIILIVLMVCLLVWGNSQPSQPPPTEVVAVLSTPTQPPATASEPTATAEPAADPLTPTQPPPTIPPVATLTEGEMVAEIIGKKYQSYRPRLEECNQAVESGKVEACSAPILIEQVTRPEWDELFPTTHLF